MHNEVKKRVEDRDIRGLQYVFANCLDVDPTFEKYEEDFDFCCKNVPELFEVHTELMYFTNNQGSWTDDYWNGLKVDLLKNFSKERFAHMRKVAQVVYAEKISRLGEERTQRQKQEEELETARRELARENKTVERKTQQENKKSQQQMQDEELEKERRKLAQENKRVEEEQKKKQNQRMNQSYSGGNLQRSEGEGTKKAVGTVLLVIVLAIIVFIIISAVKQ